MQSTTTYVSGGKPIACEFFTPTTPPNRGVIVIAYGSDGMINNQNGQWATMMRGYASDLAGKGFTALIADYFQRTGTGAGSIDYQRGGALVVEMNRDSWAAAMNDAVTHAKSLPGIDPKRVGLLGFSLGGHLCLRVRSAVGVVVQFFAPLLDGIGAGGRPGLQVQIHHGTKDDLVPFKLNAVPIEQQLKAERASIDLRPYDGAGHGFVGTDAANSTAASQSKARAIAFFESKL